MFNDVEQLFWYRIVFLIELLVAEFLFCKNLKRKERFALRLFLSIVFSSLVTLFFPLSFSNPFYISLMFIVIFISTLIGMIICFDESVWNLLFCAIASYTIQHIAYTLYTIIVEIFYLDQIMDYLIANNPYISNDNRGGYSIITGIAYLTIYFSVYWIFYFTFACRIKKNSNLHIKNRFFLLLSGIIILVDVAFNMITIFNENKDITSYYIESLYNIITCFIALELQFSQLSNKKIENELEAYKMLWAERNNQYEMSKKTIDIINIKCHDLKHQIRKIGNYQTINKQNVEEIEKNLQIYDSSYQTGNKALDVILTEKSLIGNEKSIQFNIIAEGALLNFINPTDIYSLFGNALDNAMEAVSNLKDDQKTITLIIKKINNMISIHIENYYQGELNMIDGMPKTKKSNTDYHGYGVLSMKTIIEKYQGIMSIETDNSIFKLNILFMI